MTKIKAEIVADSLSPQGDRLTSLLITFPRIILAEVNTHRMLSKNTSSSRAIPFNKMVESISDDPFIPIAFQKHHKGMQGNEYLQGKDLENALDRWNDAKNYALAQAKDLYNTGTTKQLCNRILEPFMWTTMLITGSKEGWDNFFKLRCPQYTTPVAGDGYYAKSWKELCSWHSNPVNEEILEKADLLFKLKHNKGQAEIHMMALAEAVYDAMNESTPLNLNPGEWHTPFKDKIIDLKEGLTYEEIVKISTAMAARTSYTIVGDEKEINYERMIELHDRLISQDPPHSSPMEHCARAMDYDEEYYSFVRGRLPQGHEVIEFLEEKIEDYPDRNIKYGWCNNFKGFIQYRYLIENDYD